MRARRPVAAAVVVATVLTLGGAVRRPIVHDPSVVFVAADRTLGYVLEMSLGFAAGAAALPGVTAAVKGTEIGDTAGQLALATKLPDHSFSGASVFTWNPELLAAPLAAAGASGIPVTAVHMPPAPGSGIRLYVGNDDFRLGQMLGEQLEAMIPPTVRGTVILGTSVPGALALDRRTAGVRDWLTRMRPWLRLLGPFDTKQDTAGSREAWSTLVQVNPGAVAYVGTGDTDAAALAWLRAANQADWLAGGFGVDDQALDAVDAGRFALVSPELYVQGAVAGRLQAAAASGETLPSGWLVTPGLKIDAADLPEIQARQASARTREIWAEDEVNELVVNRHAHLRPLVEVQGSLG